MAPFPFLEFNLRIDVFSEGYGQAGSGVTGSQQLGGLIHSRLWRLQGEKTFASEDTDGAGAIWAFVAIRFANLR